MYEPPVAAVGAAWGDSGRQALPALPPCCPSSFLLLLHPAHHPRPGQAAALSLSLSSTVVMESSTVTLALIAVPMAPESLRSDVPTHPLSWSSRQVFRVKLRMRV